MDKYNFSYRDISEACGAVEEFLTKCRCEPREAMRIRLAFEEILLKYRARFGEDAEYGLRCRKKFSALCIEFVFKGECFNPFGDDDDSIFIAGLLSRMGVAPGWSYKNGSNCVAFIAKKGHSSQTGKMLIAVLLSVIAGILITTLPEGARAILTGQLLTPVTNIFMGIITALAGPLVFLSVLESICSMGDMETFGKIGKKIISKILVYAVVIGAGVTVISALLFDISAGGGHESDFSKVLGMIYDIVPSNLFEPFLTGNALQIIFIAVVFGVAMLVLSSKVGSVLTVVEQLNTVVQTVMGFISDILPYVVFAIFTNIIANGDLKNLVSSWKMILIMLMLMVIYLAGIVLWISLRQRVSPITLVRKVLPTLIVALTTASSVAAFSTNVRDSHEKLGIDKKAIEFGTPLGQTMFKPCVIVLLCVMQLTYAENYGMDITISWLVLGYITNLLLSFAAPPVTGGALMGITIGLTQLGIPLEVMGIAIAVNTIIDFPGTATNTVSWQLIMIEAADSLKLLDRERLRSKNVR